MNLDHFLAHLTELVRAFRSSPAPLPTAVALVTFHDGRSTRSKALRFATDGEERELEFRGNTTGVYTLKVVNLGTLPLCIVQVSYMGRIYAKGPLLEFQFAGEPEQPVNVLIKTLLW